MYRINKVCIDLLLLLILSVSSLSAQVATTTSDGYPAIDLSAWEPLGAVLSSEEAASRCKEMMKQEPSNEAYLKPANSTTVSSRWNAKMSIKYQVMRANLGPTTNWTSAWNACKEYEGEGGEAGTWRLPTQRELMMIWILHPQLIEKGSFTAFDDLIYCSATEGSKDGAWGMYFQTGEIHNYTKKGALKVRCVRDR